MMSLPNMVWGSPGFLSEHPALDIVVTTGRPGSCPEVKGDGIRSLLPDINQPVFDPDPSDDAGKGGLLPDNGMELFQTESGITRGPSPRVSAIPLVMGPAVVIGSERSWNGLLEDQWVMVFKSGQDYTEEI